MHCHLLSHASLGHSTTSGHKFIMVQTSCSTCMHGLSIDIVGTHCYSVLSQVQANRDLQTSLQHAQQHEAHANRLQEDLQRLQAELQKVQVSHAGSGGLHICFVALLLR